MLINTNSLVLIGPGSEWFWTMLTGLVLALTFVAIYRQLRAQRAAAIFEQFKSIAAQWDAKAFRYTRLAALIDLEHRTVTEGAPQAAMTVAGWFDTLGTLVIAGHVDTRAVAATYAEPILSWWETLRPFIDRDRTRWNAPAHLADFEELARRMAAEWKRTYGRPFEVTETIGEQIDRMTAALVRDRDIERGLIPRRPEIPTQPSGHVDEPGSSGT